MPCTGVAPFEGQPCLPVQPAKRCLSKVICLLIRVAYLHQNTSSCIALGHAGVLVSALPACIQQVGPGLCCPRGGGGDGNQGTGA
jgi:hypothetical protein